MRYFRVIFLVACLASVATAGLDEAGKYNEVIAIYKFEDALDSGPRELHGEFLGKATIVELKRGKVLRIRNGDEFQASSDQSLALIPDFSIVAWIGLKKHECCFALGMRGYEEIDGNQQITAGHARIDVFPDGNIGGWFHESESGRSLAKDMRLISDDIDVADFKWHHVAFTRYGDIYTLFVDGDVVERKYINEYVSFFGDKTHIFVFGHDLNGSAFVDDLVFLEIGLSLYEVRAIKENGLDAFLKAMPVEPTGKLATTWGTLKMR